MGNDSHDAAGGEWTPDAAAALQALDAAARVRWPGVTVSLQAVARACAERVPTGTSAAEWLASPWIPELWLAVAAERGDALAAEAIATEVFPRVRRALERARVPPAVADEVLQTLRIRLFMPPERGASLLSSWVCRGDLGAWLKAVAIREASALLQKTHRELPTEEMDLVDLIGLTNDPALQTVRQASIAVFARSLERAMASLEPRDRTLLRQYYVDGLGIDGVARLHGIHRSNAARWLAKARATVMLSVKRDLLEREEISSSDLSSLIRAATSGLELSLTRLLRAST